MHCGWNSRSWPALRFLRCSGWAWRWLRPPRRPGPTQQRRVRGGCMTDCRRKFGSGFRKRFASRLPGRSVMRQKFFRRIAFRGIVFRAVAILLIGMTAVSAVDAAAMAPPAGLFSERPSSELSSASLASRPARPAGCHDHALPASLALPVVPATVPPAPRSYQCCVPGHHAANPLGPFSLRLVLAWVGEATDAGQFSLVTELHFSSLLLLSPFSSPPGSFSLRI